MFQATNSRRWRAVLAFFIRCCSRWGLHSPACHHASGELLPRLFILTQNGRLFSVALSLRLPSLAVNQHHCSMEPGLSSRSSLRNLPATIQFTLFNILLYLVEKVNFLCYNNLALNSNKSKKEGFLWIFFGS